LSGAPGDVVLSADETQIDRLDRSGLLEPGTRALLSENTLAVVGPADRAPAINKPADLLGIRRIAIAQLSCPLGKYTRLYLGRLYDTLASKSLHADNSRAVLSFVHAGQADVGIVYGSDAAADPTCEILYQFRRGPEPILYTTRSLLRTKQIQ